MTTSTDKPTSTGKALPDALLPLRELIAFALLGVAGLQLLLGLIRLIPAEGELRGTGTCRTPSTCSTTRRAS